MAVCGYKMSVLLTWNNVVMVTGYNKVTMVTRYKKVTIIRPQYTKYIQYTHIVLLRYIIRLYPYIGVLLT